ncbi:MAG: hypothetical protein HC840_12710 [Leptolyngbyaceae cyanobacterium RM2_2_4]|nr:hypothetical protein [Leptolyngbyaceae cyanobacterium RM2_2_4]
MSRWVLAQQHNDIDGKILKQILKQSKRKHFGVSGKAEKFINDLNAEIEMGWTGHGQTNRLLGRITMRVYIFHHILSGGEPLRGEALVNEIVETARSLPGYSEWCRHQHEITYRAEEWARCIENSHYFHFGHQATNSKPVSQDPELVTAIDQSPSWNQRQSAVTRDRIRKAIADLLEKDSLPSRATARFQALLQYGVGGASLYRHRDLWHPAHLVEFLPNPPIIKTDSQLDCVEDASNWLSPSSLLPTDGGNNIVDEGLSDRPRSNLPPNDSNGDDGIGDNAVSISSEVPFTSSESPLGVEHLQQALSNIKAAQSAFQEAARQAQTEHQRIKAEAVEQRHIARMQQFLDSGDPILVAEALSWARINPGILRV